MKHNISGYALLAKILNFKLFAKQSKTKLSIHSQIRDKKNPLPVTEESTALSIKIPQAYRDLDVPVHKTALLMTNKLDPHFINEITVNYLVKEMKPLLEISNELPIQLKIDIIIFFRRDHYCV